MWTFTCSFARAALAALAFLASQAAIAADLTDTEVRWLKGAWPVVVFARDAGLPLDIVVQPQPSAGAAPLAMAYVDGRCKLVLSMRDNPEAQGTLARLAPDLLDAALELMAAHELGHCRRYVDGAWYRVPASFTPGLPSPTGPSQPAADAAFDADGTDATAARREEGYGDLVGLAWTQRRHPDHYLRLHMWLVEQRSQGRVPGSPHDTLAWVRLASDRAAMAHGSIFTASTALWIVGLAAEP